MSSQCTADDALTRYAGWGCAALSRVSLADESEAAAALRRAVVSHTPLLLHDFEQTTADKGTGHMADIMNLQVTSISMRTSAHGCC